LNRQKVVKHRLTKYILIVWLAACPLFLWGEANENTSAEVKNQKGIVSLQEFEVIGSKENVFSLQGSGVYLDADDLLPLHQDDVNRILRQVPGVYIREEDGHGLFPNISLRGVDTTRSGKLTIMEDGVLTAPATYSAPSAYYTPTAGRMSGIEVLKGSSQINYGPHTTGGVINYISTPIPDQKENGNLFDIAYGSDAEFRANGHLGDTLSTKAGEFGYLLEIFHRQTDGFKTIAGAGDYPGSDDTGFKRTDYMFKGSWEPKTDKYNHFEFKIGYMDLKANETYLGLTTDDFMIDPYRRYAASRNDVINTNHAQLHLRHIVELSNEAKLTTTAYYNKFHRNWFKLHEIRDIDTDGNGVTEGDEDSFTANAVSSSLANALAGNFDGQALEVLKGERAGKLHMRNNNRDYYMAGIQTKLDYDFNTGTLHHNLELGFRFHQDRIRRFQWHNLILQDSDGNFIDDTRSANGSDGNRRQETQALAFYFNDKISKGAWSITPGIRYETLDYAYTDFTTDGTNLPSTNGSSTLDIVAPGLGITYERSENLIFFGNYHRGFSVPSPRNHARIGRVEETSDSFELGTRFNSEKGFSGEIVLFHTQFDDLLVIDNIGGAGTGESENVGNVKSTGIEALIGFDPGITHRWGFRNPYSIAFTYTNATLDGDANSNDAESIFAGGRDGNEVPYIPDFLISFTAGLETNKFRAYLNASYADETFTSATNLSLEINPNTGNGDTRFGKTDSYFIVDVGVHYELFENVEIFGTINNLFEDQYISSRHPQGARPGAPRLARVGVQYKF
jgi:Fe(3+) dicitrate transport protein